MPSAPAAAAAKLLSEVAFLANPFVPEVHGETVLKVYLQQPASVSLVIWNKRGDKIIYSVNENMSMSGYNYITWDGKDTLGRRVPAGLYIYQVTAKTGNREEKAIGLLAVNRQGVK